MWLRRSADWRDKLQQLPSPNRPFGVAILGGELTSEELEQIGKLKHLQRLDLSGVKFPEAGLFAAACSRLPLSGLPSV